jgi:hypothetical protein
MAEARTTGGPSPARAAGGADAVRVASGLNVIAGIWLILAPFILGYWELSAAMWNNVIVGALVLVMAGTRAANPMAMPGLSWVNVALGIWLILSPFALGHAEYETILWNNIVLGVIVASLAIWSAVATPMTTTRHTLR